MATSADNTYASLVHKQVFKEGVQDELRDKVYFTEFADVNTENGEYIYNRYGSDIPADMTTDDTYSTTVFEYDKDVLGLTKTAVKAEHISMDEMVKQGFLIKEDRIERHARALAERINRDTAIATLENAGQTMIDGDLVTTTNGGTTNPIVVSEAAADDILASATMKLQQENALNMTPYMIMRPKDARSFGLYAMNSGNAVGDRAITNGFQRFAGLAGFDIFVTNEVPQTQVGTASTNFTANGTVTVGGVVFTFKATPAAAGEVDLGADLATSLSNLDLAINNTNGYAAGAGLASTYFEVSAANRLILQNLNVSSVATATTLTVTANSTIGGAEGEATGDFAWATETAHILVGARGTTVLRLPSAGFQAKTEDFIDGFLGTQIRTAQKFDNTIWTKNQPKVVNIPVVA